MSHISPRLTCVNFKKKWWYFYDNERLPSNGKVWIHYTIGDIVGNNRWAGHYVGASCSYCDCFCSPANMANPNPTRTYVSHIAVEEARLRKAMVKCGSENRNSFGIMSKHDINNVFMRPGVALSDVDHGIYRMLPPELMHTTQEAITKYILATFSDIFGKESTKRRSKWYTENSTKTHQGTASVTFQNQHRERDSSNARWSVLTNVAEICLHCYAFHTLPPS